MAFSSLSYTSKIVTSFVTCSRSPTRGVRFASLMEPPAIASRCVQSDQGSQAAAIDVAHAGQVEDDALALRDYHFHGVAQVGGFFSENDTASAVDDYDVVVGADG